MTTEEVGAKGSAYYSKLANAAYDNIVERGSIGPTRTMPIRKDCGSPTRRVQPRGPRPLPCQVDGPKQGLSRHKPNGLFFDASRYAGAHGQAEQTDQGGEAGGHCHGPGALCGKRQNTTRSPGPRHSEQQRSQGVAGASSSGSSREDRSETAAKEEKKAAACSGGLGSALSTGKQKEGQQASASAGGRAIDPNRPDRYAAGGGIPTN